MITTDKYQTISRPQNHNDWSFLPIMLNAATGVSLGIVIGNCLGLL